MPRIAAETKPMKNLSLADVRADGSCVASRKLNEEITIIVNVDVDTVTLDRSWKKNLSCTLLFYPCSAQ